MRHCSVALLLALVTLIATDSCQANDVFDELINRGVPVAAGESIRLPRPTLADGLNAAAQRAAIEAAADNRYSWDALIRKSPVAPFILKISQGEERDGRVGRRLDVWFVIHGDLKTLGSDEFLNGQLNVGTADSDGGNSIKPLTDADLMSRGLPIAKKSGQPHYAWANFSILDRVRVTAATRETKSSTTESLLAASVIDPRFASDPKFPNSWQSITRDENGQRQFGPPQPYSGFGSYVKATRLVEPRGAVLVEYHLVFAEPTGWFNGANLLASKLPIVAQEVIRGARRALNSRQNAE